MVKLRKYVVKKYFQGEPKRTDFEIVEEEIQPLKDNEFLVKTDWISVDPYQRAYNARVPLPFDQFSYATGIVEESKNPEYPVGSRVVHHKGWQTYTVLSKQTDENFLDLFYKVPHTDLSPSLYVGALGMPGVTAYFGFLEICKPKAGETVVVTGAAGAVGSLVGQIAKIKGCRVIGFAGSNDKCQWLEKELGFDKALNYKTVDAAKALKEAAPKGVDCYFDNVGGELSSIIINQMNDFGRVSVCGAISAYNEDLTKLPKATILQPALVFKQLSIQGFLVSQWMVTKRTEAIAELTQWIKAGKIKAREHVTEGFDKVFDGFLGMLRGENTGKAVIKI